MTVDAAFHASYPPRGDDDIADFSIPVERIRFRVNGPDVFEAAPLLPTPVYKRFARMRAEMDAADTVGKFDLALQIFDMILLPESLNRFRERIESTVEPIDLTRQVIPALNYCLERYGLRPTPPPSPSAPGPTGGGTNSTDGVHHVVLTPTGSAQPGT